MTPVPFHASSFFGLLVVFWYIWYFDHFAWLFYFVHQLFPSFLRHSGFHCFPYLWVWYRLLASTIGQLVSHLELNWWLSCVLLQRMETLDFVLHLYLAKVYSSCFKAWLIGFPSWASHRPPFTPFVPYSPLHNVYIGEYIYLATEQTETYRKSCILIYLLTYICPSSFDCEVNTYFWFIVKFNSKSGIFSSVLIPNNFGTGQKRLIFLVC